MREIQYELWFSNTSKVSRSRWPEISVKMVRWDMAKPRHVFHRIGMISIYRGQQHKRICWFCQGVPNSPLPYRTQDLLIKSFLGVKIDVVYPMTLEECKGHTRSARIELERHLRQELICEEFQPSPPPSSDVTNFFKFWWSGQAWSLARNFTLKFGGSSCVCYGCEMSRGGPLSPCPICHSLSALHLPPNLS